MCSTAGRERTRTDGRAGPDARREARGGGKRVEDGGARGAQGGRALKEDVWGGDNGGVSTRPCAKISTSESYSRSSESEEAGDIRGVPGAATLEVPPPVDFVDDPPGEGVSFVLFALFLP